MVMVSLWLWVILSWLASTAAAERTAQLHSHAVTSYLDSSVLLNVYLLIIGTEE